MEIYEFLKQLKVNYKPHQRELYSDVETTKVSEIVTSVNIATGLVIGKAASQLSCLFRGGLRFSVLKLLGLCKHPAGLFSICV